MSSEPLAPESEASSSVKRRSIDDYKVGEIIGHGSFSKVYAALEKSTGLAFAIKAIKKDLIVKLNRRELVFRERNIMNQLRDHPFFVKLYCSFQNDRYLYFVMSFARRGELLRYISSLHGFNCETTRFYAAEIISALEKMHSLNIIHRYFRF
ncbi:3-phosphoinositide-dependent protein kinase 1 [Thelohanellus kitauei]|uniref:non-specific serine/threonine protein kinase n=1 Tax=Thelohanellus kitauei TaxID=669202 RepID=A0A0C2IWM7_THEKT|nr:3-phosphoinositide-dependent protein kinase 1 [Thelohanellus kitauei]